MKYKVHVCRTGYAHTDLIIEANNKVMAKRKALEDACNHQFSEKDADYSVKGIIEISDLISKLSDWKYEVNNGDTRLGYDEWLEHKAGV